MNEARYSNEVGFAQQTFAGTVPSNDQSTDQDGKVSAARVGDPQAFETLVKRHRPRIFALALRYTRVREDAEDVVQKTFQKTFAHLSNFAGRSSFSTWLTSIAIHDLMCLRRARALREVFIGDLNGDEETVPRLDVVDASADPEADYLRREEAEVLPAAIANLTRQLRTAIKLRELGELSTRETARHMRLPSALLKPTCSAAEGNYARHCGVLESLHEALPLSVARVSNQNCSSAPLQ